MRQAFSLTQQDVVNLRQWIEKAQKKSQRVKLQTYSNCINGQQLSDILQLNFSLTKEEVVQMGSLLLQCNIIKRLNFRHSPNFSTAANSMYQLEDPSKEFPIWLHTGKEEKEAKEPQGRKSTSADSNPSITGKRVENVPGGLPGIGNAFEVADVRNTHRSMQVLGRELCTKYRDMGLFRINLMGHEYVVASNPHHVQEIFENPKIGKKTKSDAIFNELRKFRGDGLTTIEDGELHKQTQAVISPCLAKGLFTNYLPIIINSLQKTFDEELGTGKHVKNVDMRWFWKKATLRTVGLIALSTDLYEGKNWTRFSDALTYVADEAINRVFKGSKYVPIFNYKFKTEVKYIHAKINKFIQKRKAETAIKPKDKANWDLLDVLLNTPACGGVPMSDELIRANLTTALSAGHSTTTSMLSWTLNFLYDESLRNTDHLYHIVQDIDQISGGIRSYKPTLDDVYKKMNFILCVLKESLRLRPPIPTVIRHVYEKTNVGEFVLEKGDTIMISCLGTHLHPESWPNSGEFDPFRFENAPPQPCSFIPWAGGQRQCIGREFALLVGRTAMFMLLNQYTGSLSPSANVKEDEHLFLFPSGLLMNFNPRRDSPRAQPHPNGGPSPSPGNSPVPVPEPARAWDGLKELIRTSGHLVTVVNGTKTESGNVNFVASWLVEKALSFNFQVGDSPISPNDYLSKITPTPPDKFTIVAIVVATYQGNPSENTKALFSWLQQKRKELEGGNQQLSSYLSNIHYFVFGCGNMNWVTTYQKVAKFIDETMALLGAKRLCPACLFNEEKDELEETVLSFYKVMAPALMHALPEIGSKRLREIDAGFLGKSNKITAKPASSAVSISFEESAEPGSIPLVPSTVSKTIFRCPIKRIINITPNSDIPTCHIEFQMQPGMKYRAGDHLVICPVMPEEIVDRALAPFVDYEGNTVVRWDLNVAGARFHLPTGKPLTVQNILSNLVDLKATPTKQFLINYSTICEKPEDSKELSKIANDTQRFKQFISDNVPLSNVDIIEKYPIQPDRFGRLLEILPVIRPRPYSISSSPSLDPTTVHLSVGVVNDTFPNGKTYQGVSSHYLFSLIGTPRPAAYVYVEPADDTFKVPDDDTKPLILISAGTGFAPMRGFLQERLARKATGEIYVFFGCRSEDTDYLYSDELEDLKQKGIVTDIFVGFSRSKKFPRAYVQDRIAEKGELVWKAIHEKGAYIFVCGSGSRVGVGARDALTKIAETYGSSEPGWASDYITNLQNTGRYEQDVWG